jgi:superfamily II DNA or RNA helicase
MSTPNIIDQLSLWGHQRDAVDKMRKYISDYHNNKVNGSGLVYMPTGSGKTGVIATLARCIPRIGCVLILTPRIALREQLVRDVRGRFFEHLKRSPEIIDIPKNVIEFVGSFEDLELQDIESTVLISTIQKLQTMNIRNLEQFEKLSNDISLVIFDEGHYEPARTWSRVIREIQAPRIIFTATPYRNDLKAFDVDLNHVFTYTYNNAVRDNYVREVEIVERPEIEDPELFIDDVLNFFDEGLGERLNETSRVIIRCESRATIRQIATVLRRRGRSYIALHENFSDNDSRVFERKTVPDPQVEDATFWIHQFKLLEGIDDPRFQLLAIHEPFRTARPLIQQIGRIIRNPLQDIQAKGYVLDHSGGLQYELWDGYVSYDSIMEEQGGLGLAVGDRRLANLIDAQPGATYLEGRFRSQLDLDSLIPSDELLLPRRINILQKMEHFNLDRFCEELSHKFENEDCIFRLYQQDEDTAVFVYVSFGHSRYLRSKSFIEPKLGITVIHEMSNLLAFYDSFGFVPLNQEEYGIGKALPSKALKNLYKNHPSAYLTNISLRNTNLGSRSIRSRSLSAAILRETISAFDDHAQICTTARGYSIDDSKQPEESRVRRYVGFSKGRISQSSSKWCSLEEYLEWIRGLVDVTQRPINSLNTFHRYAPEEVEVEDPTPLHILLDLFEIEDRFNVIKSNRVDGGEILEIENRAYEIVDDLFTVTANQVKCEVKITFDEVKKKYVLDSPVLDDLYSSNDPSDKKGLIDYLNREQSFRVIPRSENVIYVLGEFYRPIFKVGRDFNRDDFEVSKILIPSDLLRDIESEKFPILENGEGWSRKTLFGIIDDLGSVAGVNQFFGNPDILVCDDMGTGIADFVLADTNANRVVFIHAKASRKKRSYSASALHDVCAQATKNLNYLGMFNEETPPNLNRWDESWRSRGYELKNRIRIGDENGEGIWTRIRSIIRHPLAEREVWLFLGQTLSKHEFEENLSRQPPTPEALQSAFLIHTTMTNVASVGAKLLVFCHP